MGVGGVSGGSNVPPNSGSNNSQAAQALLQQLEAQLEEVEDTLNQLEQAAKKLPSQAQQNVAALLDSVCEQVQNLKDKLGG